MRNLTQEEIDQALDNNGESEEGFVAIEATVQELADLGTGTSCGTIGNTCFKALADKGYGHRKCRGWFLKEPAKTAYQLFLDYWKDDQAAMRKKAFVSTKAALEESLLKPEDNRPCVSGMFHIKIRTDRTAAKVSKIADEAGGSLRDDGDSLWDGYKEFEIE